ncbi:MAG: hypothetical protein J6J21_04695 [Clostridia bacterium]|nr:hypothetical protein [Clostridia bacterium]
MIKATPVRDIEDRNSLLESIGLEPLERECLITVTEEKQLHAFYLFVFCPEGGRVTRVISFPGASTVALDLGLRAVVNFLDRAGGKTAFFEPPTDVMRAIAKSIGFLPVEGKANELALDIKKFFEHPCQGH